MKSQTIKKRQKINRVFGFKSQRTAKIYEKAGKKKHRNLTPFFRQNYQSKEFSYTTWFFLQRCETHDLLKNTYLNALRLAKGEREAIRRERRETLDVLIPTLVAYCDFAPSSELLFEVRANVEHIAKMCNQAYTSYDSVSNKYRVRYDTVLNAIEMLEEAELITVLREYDKQGQKQKPMRIWLNVEFFLMFGITEKQLREVLLKFHKYQFVNNQLEKTFKNYQKHLDKMEQKGVADIKRHHSLRNLLIKRRKDLLGERIIQFVAQRKPNNYLELDIERDVFKPCFRSFSDCNSPDEVEKLRKRLWDRELVRQKAREKALNNRLYKAALMQQYSNELH
ncbi:RepA family replication protein [Muribacter muris]|nr:RepA family replication protein [Muribacter muris]